MSFLREERLLIETFVDGIYTTDRPMPYGPDAAVVHLNIYNASGDLLELPLSSGTITVQVSENNVNFVGLENGEIDLTQLTYDRPFYTLGNARYIRAILAGVTPADASSVAVSFDLVG